MSCAGGCVPLRVFQTIVVWRVQFFSGPAPRISAPVITSLRRAANSLLRRNFRLITAAAIAVVFAGCADNPVSPAKPRLLPAAPSLSLATTIVGDYAIVGLGDFGGGRASPSGFNSRGDLVGSAEYPLVTSTQNHAALWPAGSSTPRDLGTLSGGFTSYAQAINDAGDVVGMSQTSTFGIRPVVWRAGGPPTALAGLGGSSGAGLDINNSGTIVGYSNIVGDRASHAALWPADGTPPLDLRTLGGTYSFAVAINDAGTIVGEADPASGQRHAVVWAPGATTPRDLGSLDGGIYRSSATDINNSGTIVGVSGVAGFGNRAVVWPADGGPIRNLGTLGGNYSEAYGINDAGDVVGYSHDADHQRRAVIWRGGTGAPIELGAVDGLESIAHTIANDGTIAGYMMNRGSTFYAVKWIPVKAPVIGAISAPLAPVQVDAAVSIGAQFTDQNARDTHTAVINWGDGTSSAAIVTENNGAGSAQASHSYTAAGVYTVTVRVTDQMGLFAESTYRYVVVFDPSAGFTTGAGWINSPAGAYTADPTLAGRGKFGFVSRYQKGTSVPGGNTQFQFDAADLSFKSVSYDWMVIAGATVKLKGSGTINGAGDYAFQISATDGDALGQDGPDKFRIKITDKATGSVVYDNQLGADENAEASTAIGGGSIAVHQ